MILILKVLSACALLFVSVFFVLQHWDEFQADITGFNPAPIFFFAAILFVCFYIGYIVSRIEDEQFHRSERFDLIYKVIFSFNVVYIAIRAIFIEPFVGVPVASLSAALAIGIINWFIPAIRRGDDDF